MMKKEDKNLRLPRYTSYPTAPHFHPGVGAGDEAVWLQVLPEEAKLSLYLHIPFCRQLCWFCGCHMRVVNHDEPVLQYLKRLKQEITLTSEKTSARTVRHIHFGGGSPTILSPEAFTGLMKHLGKHFTIASDAEIAIEIDPRTVTEEKIRAYAKAGVTRVSLGVQDFNPQVQQAVNRIQPFDQVRSVVETLKRYGISALNMDLIYGLPHQSTGSIENTVILTSLLSPDRVALFGYAHVPWMKKHQQLIEEKTLPNSAQRRHLFLAASRHLQQTGYLPVGLDHFAKPGDSMINALNNHTLQRNFQGYTTDHADALLGFGVSAISSFPQGYVQNTSNSIAYVEALKSDRLPTCKGLILTDEDRLRREVIMTLMTYLSVDLEMICRKHGKTMDFFKNELENLQPFIRKGIIDYDENHVTLKRNAHLSLRRVASVFDTTLKETSARYSQAV